VHVLPSSLAGDWKANELKFPLGISWIAKEVNAMGLRFGLWFEPEMVSEKSELYKKHVSISAPLCVGLRKRIEISNNT